MVGMNEVVRHWKKVFGNWRYGFLSLVIALGFYLFNVILVNYQTLFSFFPYLSVLEFTELFFYLSVGLKEVMELSSFISLIVVSILLGVLFSLIFYKAKLTRNFDVEGTGFISSLGIFLAAFVPGCATCGLGLASALGLGGAFFTVLPFKGIELSIVSMVLLVIAIFKISNSSCNIMSEKKMKGGIRE